MGVFDDVKAWSSRQKAPVSVGFAFSLLAAALILWFTHMKGMDKLSLNALWTQQPWTLLTYPWAWMPFIGPLAFLWVAVDIAIMLWFGGDVEREMGSGRYAAFVAAMILLPGLILAIAGNAFGYRWEAAGPWLPCAAVVVAWCNRNPRTVLNIWGILPLAPRWLGWIVAAGVLFTYGLENPALGILACLHLGVTWAFATDKLPITFVGKRRKAPKIDDAVMGGVKYDEKYYNEVQRREQERAERERLRKLFEGSLDDQ